MARQLEGDLPVEVSGTASRYREGANGLVIGK